MRKYFKYICLPLFLAALSCGKDPLSPQDGLPADLVLDIESAGVSISTKSLTVPGGGGLVADNGDPTTWTSWERAVDGQGMYRLTLFLIETSTNNLVGYRDIYYYGDCDGDGAVSYGNEKGDINNDDGNHNGWWDGSAIVTTATNGKMAKVSFEYDDPLHKSSSGMSLESLKRGKYRIIAVANWSAEKGSTAEPTYGMTLTGHPDGVQKFSGLGSDLGAGNTFKDIVENIKTEFQTTLESGTAKKFSEYAKYSAFSDFVLNSSPFSFLCYPMPMPLVAVEDIEVEPGFNHKSLQMKRCYSRVRITVVNNSACDLTVHNLSFCDKFTKTKTYLFDNPSDPDRCFNLTGALYGAKEGAPKATDAYALQSFYSDTKVPALGGDNAVLLFDSYILENRDLSNPLTYTLNLEYVGQTGRPYYEYTYTLKSETPITSPSSSEIEDGGFYLMKNQIVQSRFLYDYGSYVGTYTDVNSGNNVSVSDLPNPLPEKLVWRLESTGTANEYYIKTPGTTPYYMENPGSNVALVPMKGTYFTLGPGNSDANIAMKSSSSDNYINVNGDNQDQVMGWNDADGGSQFQFYRVLQNKIDKVTPVTYNNQITLTRVDPISAVVTPVNTINRNDFINIVVTVSYNKDAGELEFKVSDWNPKTGEIIFN